MQTKKFRKNGKFPKSIKIKEFLKRIMKEYKVITKIVKLGKKGQITIPRKIRKEENFKENDKFVLTHITNGELILKKKKYDSPEKRLLNLIKTFKPFDWRKAWEEVREERKRDR